MGRGGGGGVGIGEREEHIHAGREGDGGSERAEDDKRVEYEMEEGMSHLEITKKNNCITLHTVDLLDIHGYAPDYLSA